MNLPQDFLKEFNQFNNWGKELNHKLLNENIDLASNFSTWQNEYMTTIQLLGEICFCYDDNLQSQIRTYVHQSDIYKFHLEAPYYQQIINKPRGYAGDAEMMRIIYRNEFEGRSKIGMLLHKIATECPACYAVRNRKELMIETLNNLRGEILSFAGGPVEEIFEVLKNDESNKYNFTAIDHDIETVLEVKKNKNGNKINYGIANAFHLIKGNRQVLFPRIKNGRTFNPKKDTQGLNAIFLPLKYRMSKLRDESYDLVYSAGLFDYIKSFPSKEKGTIALTKQLFDLVKPKGQLLIGNFSDKNPLGVKWIMEFICDWFLIYRNKQQVMDFSKAIDVSKIASINVVTEEKGINHFLSIKKR